MTIDIEREKLLSIAEAAMLCGMSEAGVRHHADEGYRGVKLETLTFGKLSRTSVEAIHRFSKECSKIRAADKENRLTAAADSVGRGEPFGTEEVPT